MRARFLGALLLLPCLLPSAVAMPASGLRDRGSTIVLDAASGRELGRVAANGAVVVAIADGRGGWFVGGSFSRLGGRHRVALARLLASGKVDPTWQASIGTASGRPVAVYALARAGTRLFAAGPFGRVGGRQRPGLAALDASTGAVIRHWAPTPRAWLDVSALAVAGERLLVARNWNYPIPGITALATRTANVDRHWNPHLRLIGDAGSFNTLLPSGRRLYVAGSFHVAGLRRNGLVALDAANGRPDPDWAPRAENCSVCNGFAVLYGLAASARRVYVSGYFRRVNGVLRDGLAALDPRSGAVDPDWKPARGGTDVVHLALTGSRLYLGGMRGFWALNAGTGAALRLPPNHAAGDVLALAVSGRLLLVAGRT
jgi:hypothetical protein